MTRSSAATAATPSTSLPGGEVVARGDGANLPATANFAGMRLPVGWAFVAATCIKLWITLLFAGSRGFATAEELATLTGLSPRTIYKNFDELAALGLLTRETKPGKGIRWELQDAPLELPDTARDIYDDRIDGQKKALTKRKKLVGQLEERLAAIAEGAQEAEFSHFAEQAKSAFEKPAESEPQETTSEVEGPEEDSDTDNTGAEPVTEVAVARNRNAQVSA